MTEINDEFDLDEPTPPLRTERRKRRRIMFAPKLSKPFEAELKYFFGSKFNQFRREKLGSSKYCSFIDSPKRKPKRRIL